MAENKWVTGVVHLIWGVVTWFITGRGPTLFRYFLDPRHRIWARLLGAPNSHLQIYEILTYIYPKHTSFIRILNK